MADSCYLEGIPVQSQRIAQRVPELRAVSSTHCFMSAVQLGQLLLPE